LLVIILASDNEKNMLKIMTEVGEKHCGNCKIGAAGKEVGYLCPGIKVIS
jgi:hypothetical protein